MPETPPIRRTLAVAGAALVVAAAAVGVGSLALKAPTAARPPAAAPSVPASAADRIRIGAAAKAVQDTLGDDDPHLAALRERLAQNPDDPDTLVAMGDRYVVRREYAKARGYYLRAARVAPANLAARTHLGTVAYFLGHVDEALHHYHQALALDPDYTVALFEMGAVLRYGKKDLPAAVETWEHFLRLDPDAEEADRIRDLVAEAKGMIADGTAPTPVPPETPEAAPPEDPNAETAPWPGTAADGAR